MIILAPRATHRILHTPTHLTQFMEFKVEKRGYLVLYIVPCITKVLVWKLWSFLSVKPSMVRYRKKNT